MFAHIRRALSAAWQKSRSVRAHLVRKRPVLHTSSVNTTSSGHTLVPIETVESNYTLPFAYTFTYPFDDLYATVSGNEIIKSGMDDKVCGVVARKVTGATSDNQVTRYMADHADCEVVSAKTTAARTKAIGAEVCRTYSIGGSVKAESSAIVSECDANVCSDVSIDDEHSEYAAAEKKAKAYFNELRESERDNLNIALCTLFAKSEGKKVSPLEHIKMHSVLRMAFYRRLRGDQATLASPLMATAIVNMGIDNAMYYVCPMIEGYYCMHSSDGVFEMAFP